MEEQTCLEGFKELFPKEKPPHFQIKYRIGRRRYSASARLFKHAWKLQFILGNEWKEVSEEIKKGLFQEMIVRILKRKVHPTLNMKLYSSFVKNIHLSIPKDRVDAELKESFDRVNEKYFHGLMEMPNLKFEGNSTRHLAEYDFHEDMIRVSQIFRGAPKEILDYLVYHELLHKSLKFKYSNGRNYYHTEKFRRMELQFENAEEIERRIEEFLKSKRGRNWKSLLFRND